MTHKTQQSQNQIIYIFGAAAQYAINSIINHLRISHNAPKLKANLWAFWLNMRLRSQKKNTYPYIGFQLRCIMEYYVKKVYFVHLGCLYFYKCRYKY